MVIRPAAIAALLALACTAAAPPVTRVTITENGARSNDVSGDETVATCRRFRLTAADVRTFFAAAAPVEERAFVHDLDQSRCHAAGTLRLPDGHVARWFIDRERRGSLAVAGRPTRYLYCLSCRSPRFDPLDDETRETATALIRAARQGR